MYRKILFILLFIPGSLWAQESVEEIPAAWKVLQFFEGSWEGESSGMSGTGTCERNYEFILGRQFLYFKNRAVYEPQGKNPEGETHEDWGFFSYDQERKSCVLRQFHVEGYINQYVLDSLSDDGNALVFVTESIENVPKGWRARLSFTKTGNDSFTEIFELAAPGKEFSVCSENRWTRKK